MADPHVPTMLDVRADMDAQPWTELHGQQYVYGTVESVGLLARSTRNGKPIVGLLVRTPNGWVVAHTTLALARQAATFLAATPIAQEDK